MKEEEKKDLKNKKKSRKTAFTLIELLAVIIILGVLMIIAVPAVTKYINDSRKTGYVSSAKSIIKGVSTLTNSEELGMVDKNTTYYIPASYVKTEKDMKTPYGNLTKAYVGVVTDGNSYDYYWISNDSSGHGIKTLTEMDLLKEDQIESNVIDDDITGVVTTTGVQNRSKILILDDNGEWKAEIQATHTMNQKGRRVKLDFINGVFISGIDFNTKIKILAGATGNVNPGTLDQNIQYIRRSTVEPTSQNKQTRNLVSTSTSEVPIYAWFDNGTIYWWTEDVTPNMNETAEVMFYNLRGVKEIELEDIKTDNTTNMGWMFGFDLNLESLDLSNFDTSNVTTMASMFMDGTTQSKLETINGLEYFDTSNVTTMTQMFAGLKNLKSINVSKFNTSKVTNMSYMFAFIDELTELDVRSFNTQNVTSMQSMFSGLLKIKTLDVSSFNTGKVTDMRHMFSCSSTNTCQLTNIIGLDRFNTSNVTEMCYMFYHQTNIRTLDLSSFNTSKVTCSESMFAATNLTKIYASSNFVTTGITNSTNMFSKTSDGLSGSEEYVLTGGAGTAYDGVHKDKEYARIDDPANNRPGYFTLKTNS